jgi:hypothetical protein
MNYENSRIAKLRNYLFDIIDELSSNDEYQINANMLSNDINNYSLDKVPTESTVERWVMGLEIHRDVFTFRSRVAYSQDVINNLENIGFFESFEELIKSNNDKGILPEIDGIESIECLNCGSLTVNDTDTAVFNIQIQITYKIMN